MSLSLKDIAAAVEALLAAPQPDDAIAVLRKHEQAFKDAQALPLIDRNLERNPADVGLQKLLQNRRLIISEFQRGGVEAARVVMQGGISILDLINTWLACSGWVESFRFLESNLAILLSDEVRALLDEIAEQYAQDPHGGPKLQSYVAMLAIAQEEGVVAARRWLCRGLLSTLIDEERPLEPEAKAATYEVLLALTDKASEPEAWLANNVNYGNLLRSLGRDKAAIACFESALELADEVGSPEHFSGIHRSLGNIFNSGEAADDEKAAFHYAEALRPLSAASDPANYLHLNHMLGLQLSESGQRDAAIAHYRAALAVPMSCSPDQWVQVSTDLADALKDDFDSTRQTSLGEAIERLECALEYLDKSADPDRWARVQRNLGMAYRDIESTDRTRCLERAMEYTQAAMSVWTRQQNPYAWAQLQHNLGTIRYLQRAGDLHDNLVQASNHYKQTLVVHTREQYPRDWALTKSALGMCYLMLNRLSPKPEHIDAAIEVIEQALDWLSGDGADGSSDRRKLQAEAENALGNALVERNSRADGGYIEEGIAHMRVSESLYSSLGMPERQRSVLANLARAYSLLSETDATAFRLARETAQRALQATSRDTDAYSWAIFQRNYAAILANAEDPALGAEALKALEDVLEIFSREKFPGEFGVTQGFVGHVQFTQRNWLAACSAYSQAIDAMDEVVRLSYTESGQDYQIAESSLYFMRAAYCLVELGRPADALVMLDRGKGRALSLDMALTAALRGASSQDQELCAAAEQVAALEAEMSRAPRLGRRSDAELGTALREARGALQKSMDGAQLAIRADLELDELLDTAPEGGALLALLVTSQGSLAFVVPSGLTALAPEHVLRLAFTSNDLHALLLGSDQAPGLIRTYLRARAAADPASAALLAEDYRRQLGDCCATLWESMLCAVAERLQALGVSDGAPLCLLPQGGLGLLPLHAACDATGRRPLLERYAMSYAPSAYLLSTARRALRNNAHDHSQAASLFAAINPTGDLPFAELEGALLADLFAQRGDHVPSPMILRGIQATARKVKPQLSQHSYLHFACHGSFNFRDPSRSALFLAGGQPLELAELMGPAVDMTHSRMVVLSACETGITEFRRSPDEYIGLPATFLKAGAATVLSTLWAVNDIASAMLVVDFYRRHIINQQSPAEALRQAQLWIARASRQDLLDWLEQAAKDLSAPDGTASHRVTRLLAEFDAARLRIAGDGSVERPFGNPWFWAGYCLNGA